MISVTQLRELVQPLRKVFTRPSLVLFENLLEGWILCPCRRFITSVFQFGDPDAIHAHDSYHRFFRCGAWSMAAFFKTLATIVVTMLGHPNVLWLMADDTVHKKTGRKVDGAKYCRDAVRSTSTRVVYAWGLQIVLLCLEVQPPWGGEPLALPINMRLYRKRPSKKSGKTLLDLLEEMIVEVAEWFTEQQIILVADGFYAPLAGRMSKNTFVVSRIRSDAAIYRKSKRIKGKRGRPPSRGVRLPTPAQIATTAKDWRLVETVERGKTRQRLVIVRHVVWHKVLPGKYIRLIISRDPEGIEKDDFFFTTDLTLEPGLLVSTYANRWAIEDTFRNAKQFLGIEQPQSWKGPGPEKVAAMGYAVYAIVWAWFIKHGDHQRFPERPWYQSKTNPSFQDALAGIRHQIWTQRISTTVLDHPEFHKFTEIMIESLARAA